MIRRAGRLPVVVGVSAPGFAAMRALTREVMERGAAGVMIAPPNTLRTDDQIVGYYRQAVEAIGADVPFVIQDYPLTFSVQMTPGGDPPHRAGTAFVRDAQARGLARGWRRSRRCAASRKTVRCAISPSSAATTACSSTTRWSAAPTAPTPGYCFPDMLCDVVRSLRSRPARGRARPVRCPPAAAALRAAARRGAGGAQVRDDAARLADLGRPAQAGGGDDAYRQVGGRPSAGASGTADARAAAALG